MGLTCGHYRTAAGSEMRVSGDYCGNSVVVFDWLQEGGCLECQPSAYDVAGMLVWNCDYCGGGSAELIPVLPNSAPERMVVKLLAEQCGINESTIVPTALLADDLCMDSLDHIEVVMAIESYFGVEIPNTDYDGIETVQGVFDMVNKHVPNAPVQGPGGFSPGPA